MRWGAMIIGAALTAAHAAAAAAQAASPTSCALCLYGPDNMVFDPAGNMYLVDTDHKTRSRVLKLAPDGHKLAEWHVFASAPGVRNGPEGIALDRNGNVLVTDAGSRHVLKLSPDGTVLATIGETPGTFRDLGHVAIDWRGNIYVAEASPNRIQKFSPAGVRIAIWQRPKGAGPEDWNNPQTIAIADDSNLVVDDWQNRRIEILSPSGKTILTFGGAGHGPGQLVSSSGIFVDQHGEIYVSDYELRRVQEFDGRGRLQTTIGGPGAALFEERPGAVAVDAHGYLYSPDGLSIVKYSRDGKALARWR